MLDLTPAAFLGSRAYGTVKLADETLAELPRGELADRLREAAALVRRADHPARFADFYHPLLEFAITERRTILASRRLHFEHGGVTVDLRVVPRLARPVAVLKLLLLAKQALRDDLDDLILRNSGVVRSPGGTLTVVHQVPGHSGTVAGGYDVADAPAIRAGMEGLEGVTCLLVRDPPAHERPGRANAKPQVRRPIPIIDPHHYDGKAWERIGARLKELGHACERLSPRSDEPPLAVEDLLTTCTAAALSMIQDMEEPPVVVGGRAGALIVHDLASRDVPIAGAVPWREKDSPSLPRHGCADHMCAHGCWS